MTVSSVVGDVVIMNYVDRPHAALVCVVVGTFGDQYLCRYLNADPAYDKFNSPHMRSSLREATRLQDFGVDLFFFQDEYWCQPNGASVATYADGKPRKWQESNPVHHRFRQDVATFIKCTP